MNNLFEIPVEDAAGAPAAGVVLPVYSDAACTTPVTGSPFTSDADGMVSPALAGLVEVFAKAPGSTKVVAYHCVNDPLLSDYTAASPLIGDSIIFADASDGGKTKSMTLSDLFALFLAQGGFWLTGTASNHTQGSGTADPTGGADGDSYFKVP